MANNRYWVTFMVAPAVEYSMWAGSEEVVVDRPMRDVHDTAHIEEAIRDKLNLLDDSKIYVMACDKTKKRKEKEGAYRGHIGFDW